MLDSTFIFSTADAADNTYTRLSMRYYVVSWIIVIFVMTILVCHVVLSNIKKSKASSARFGNLIRSTTTIGSDRTGVSGSDKADRSDAHADKTKRMQSSYRSSHHQRKSSEKRSSRKEKGASTRSKSSGEKRSQRSR